MKETPLSNCERQFILKAIENKERLDGRQSYDYRRIKIEFGIDRGCCTVELGETIVMAKVSCEVGQPKQTRPTEGFLYINVEFSPMAEAHFEPGKQTEQANEMARVLERCLRDSRAVDLESLCIMAGAKVWKLRVDIKILNYDGNTIDASALCSIAALSHFRRPDITVSGEEVTIHSIDEKDPIPLSIHHLPLCVTIAFFHQGTFCYTDPIAREEKVMDGKMIIGMNKHREICTLQMTGNMLLNKEQVLRCTNIATVKIVELNDVLQKALSADEEARSSGKPYGTYVADFRKVTVKAAESPDPSMSEIEEEARSMQLDSDRMEESEEEVVENVVKNSWLLRIKESKAKEAEEVKKTIGNEIDEFLTTQRQESDLQQQSIVNNSSKNNGAKGQSQDAKTDAKRKKNPNRPKKKPDTQSTAKGESPDCATSETKKSKGKRKGK